MRDHNGSVQDPAELRRRAEAALAQRPRRPKEARGGADLARMVHELEVHQIELEMQNAELVAARNEAEAVRQRYTDIFDFAPIGYFVVAAEGTIHELNLAGARLLRMDRVSLVGQRLSQFVPDAQRAELARFLVEIVRSQERGAESSVFSLKESNGEARDVRLTGVRLADTGAMTLIAAEDVTERNRAERELLEGSRRKDEFLAVLSHELRNPLGAIKSGLFVLERAGDEERTRRARAIVERQMEHLTRIVDELLDVSRIAHGKIHLHRTVIELTELVRSAMGDYRQRFEASGVALEASVGSEPLWVDADATRLMQVVDNLLTNAIKFTPAGGKVEVSLRREPRHVVLSVRDTGVGIAPEMQPRLFTAFVQAPQSSDRTRGGLGLGLAMVKGLVELHGGTVQVSSGGVGRGAELTVRLPAAQPPPAQVAPGAHREPSHRRVLVIEDNEDGANSLRDVLELSGHEVEIAHDGPRGIGVAREFHPEVVICDIGLPGMDGYDVARAMRAEADLKGTFLVALTGYTLPEDARRASEAGFDRHVAKPPSIEKLERVLADASRGGGHAP